MQIRRAWNDLEEGEKERTNLDTLGEFSIVVIVFRDAMVSDKQTTVLTLIFRFCASCYGRWFDQALEALIKDKAHRPQLETQIRDRAQTAPSAAANEPLFFPTESRMNGSAKKQKRVRHSLSAVKKKTDASVG